MIKLLTNKKAFTLTEIVVAVVVLAAAISGLWASFIASKRYTAQAKARVMAIHNARYVLEGLRQDVRADTWDTGRLRDGIVDEDITSWLPSGDDTFVTKYDGTAKYSVIDPGGGYSYRKVNLTMAWQQPELE